MNLWIVYTGWQGNGAEGVIVNAGDDETARLMAHNALITSVRAETNSGVPSGDQVARLANYGQYRETWRAEAIELPYVGEFG